MLTISDKIKILESIIDKYRRGLFIKIDTPIINEVKDYYRQTKGRNMCGGCSGDIINAIDLYIKKLRKELNEV